MPPLPATLAVRRARPASVQKHESLDIAGWQKLAAADPTQAARELISRLQTALTPQQHRACFASVRPADELANAFQRAAEAHRNAPARHPFAGAPFTVKDLYHIAGQQPRAGSRFPFELLPVREKTSKLPLALEEAGAVLAARTHLYEFAYGLTGENENHGDCEHPFFPGRTTGGSSSGAAASVAAGIVPFAIGTDTGGSIRVPAAFCGLFGMRLTPGDEWITDAFPLAPAYDTAGWLTQTAADMAFINRVILGDKYESGQHHEPASVAGMIAAKSTPAPAAQRRAKEALHGCFVDLKTLGLDAVASREITKAYRESARKFTHEADHETREQISQAFRGTLQAYAILQSTQAYNIHAHWLDRHRAHYSEAVWQRIDRGRHWHPEQIEAAHIKQRQLRNFWKSFFKTYDYLVMPATPFTALPKAECTHENREHLLALMVPASLSGLPVLTIPVHLSSGLSTGLQIIVNSPQSPVISAMLNKA